MQQVDSSLISVIAAYTERLLSLDGFNASRCAVGLVTSAAELIGDDRFDRMVLISALRSIADDLESARRIIH
jgi:hypothetical protein